jgi:glycosyltransferase involved in cell wall biosynthesis
VTDMYPDKKINIAYLVSRLRRQGPFFQLYNIIKHLDHSRFHPRVITLSPEAPDLLMDDFKREGVDCTSLALSRKTDMLLGPKKLKKLFQNSPPDLIHVSGLRSAILCANHFAGIPRIVTCRQIFDLMHYTLSGNPWLLGCIKTKVFSMACKKYDRVIAVSESVKNSATAELADRIEVVYNGVNQDIYKPFNPIQKAHARSKLGLPQDKRIFLSTGFLSKLKDPLTVIKAFLRNKTSRTDMLVLLGDGPLRAKCSALAAQTNNIRIEGFVENVSEYLGASDVLVSGSLFEGCPNSVMEALAYGLAVILSDIPSHREILAFDSKAGVTFKTGNINSLVQSLSKIDQQEYPIRSQAALKIVNNHLNARGMSLKYQQIYTELYNKHCEINSNINPEPKRQK